MKVTIFVEMDLEHTEPNVLKVYPDGLSAALESLFPDDEVRTANVFLPNCGLSPEILADTDVLLWWGHAYHDRVPDEVCRWVLDAVHAGMGFVALHSAHMSKPFRGLMGTSCCLRWRDNEHERVWITDPGHPIAQGLPETFVIPCEEMYGEHFDIPTPENLIAIGWFRGGEVFRSVCTYTRGLGHAVYIQFGHETCPIYHHPEVRKIVGNAARWAAARCRKPAPIKCTHPEPVEK